MSDIIPEGAANAFTKKIGPLPGIAWVAIIAGVVWLVFLWRKRGAAAGNSVPASAVTPAAVGFSSAGPMPGTNNYSGTVSTTPVGQPASTSNASWAKTVTDFLVGTGNYSPTDVSNALANYLGGAALTAQQSAIINTAIKQFQTPPEGVIPTATPGNYTGFLRDDITGAIFGILPNGVREWLTGEQYAALGNPAVTSTVQNQFQRYERDAAGKIYGIMGTGQRVWLSADQFAALGSPAAQQVGAGDSTATPGITGGHKYTLVAGDTPETVAKKMYGTTDTSALTAANPGVLWNAGTVITVP